MKKFFVASLAAIFLALLIPGLGMTQDPPTPNILGLYEFSDGTGATESYDIGSPITVYLVLKNPADEQNGDEPYPSINAFECQLNFNPPGNLFKLAEIIPCDGCCMNVGDSSDISQGFLEYIIGFNVDYFVTDESIVLIEFVFMHTAAGNIEVTLGSTSKPSIPGEMVFQSVVGELRVMHSASGPHGGPVYLFSDGPDPVVSSTFGSVKALYR